MTSIQFYEVCSLVIGAKIVSRSIKEVIRIINSKEVEQTCAKKKFVCQVDLVDMHSRVALTPKMATTSAIKCTNTFNYYVVQSKMINK